MSEIGVDSPVSTLIGLGQGRLLYNMTETGMIQFTASGIEADGYVAQAFSISKLSECHDQELIPASKLTDTFIAIVPVNATIEFIVRNILHYLRKDRSSLIHYHSPLGGKSRRIRQKR